MSITEINSLSYADTINRAFVYGTSPYPLARTSGVYSAGGAVSILKEVDTQIIKQLGNGYARMQFDITISFIEKIVQGGSLVDGPLITDQLVSCAFGSAKDSMKYGPDALYVERDLTIIKIIRDGISPY